MEINNSFGSTIQSANSILILLPTKPYFDQIAAGLGLYLSLKGIKDVSISSSAQMLVEYNRLIGINKITQEVGNKNLTIKFTGYNASDIERVSYDIENGEFRLTIIPKPGFASPKKEQVNFNYSGMSADTVILIGGGNETHFPMISSKDFLGAKIVHIGTKSLIVSDKEVMSFARPASSTSEIIASLIKESDLGFDPDIATNLLAGIEEGSNQFKNPEVTAETFQIVADLMKSGGKRGLLEKIDRGGFPKGSIPGEDIQLEEIEKKEEPPKDWLAPKIFKGTSVS
jgi:hypothetical protein